MSEQVDSINKTIYLLKHQIKQIKRGGGYDVIFINKDDLEMQSKNDSDIISFEDGLVSFKGSKQQGIEDAIQKAQQIIEQQSSQKKKSQQQIQSKPSQQTITNKTVNQTEGLKSTSSTHLSKRKNPINKINNSNDIQHSIEEHHIQDLKPSKKQKIQTDNKGKNTPVQTTRSNSSTKSSQIVSHQPISVKNNGNNKRDTQLQSQIITSQKGATQKKNEKINEKQQQKNEKIQQNAVSEGKRTPTRSQTQKLKEDVQIQDIQTKSQKGSVSPIKLKKQDIDIQKQLSNVQQQKIKKNLSIPNKENFEEKISAKTQKKQSQQNEELKQNEKKNKGEQTISQDNQKKQTQISSNLESSTVRKKKENSKIAQSSNSATSSKSSISKKEKKQESKQNKENIKNNQKLKQTVKQEQISSHKKNYNNGRSKWSSQKKEKYGDYMEEEEQKYNYNSNNLFEQRIYEQNNLSDQQQNMDQHLQESPDFGFKQQIDQTVQNIKSYNQFEDISKNLFSSIQNNMGLNNLNSISPNPVSNGINNNFIEQNKYGIRNNVFQGNDKQSSYQEYNTNSFSLNNSPFGIKDRKIFDDQDELNMTSHPNENNKSLTINQQYQVLLSALKSGNITPQQLEYYQQKFQNGGQNSLFDCENKKNTNNNQNQINQNMKLNNIFASLSDNQSQDYQTERKSIEINALNNITNTFQNYNNQQNANNQLQNSLLNGISLSNQGTGNLINQQSSVLSFGVPKQEYQNQTSTLNSQIFGFNQDIQNQVDIIGLSKSPLFQSRQNSFSSGSQEIQPTSFSNNVDLQNSNTHSIVIPSPQKIIPKSNNQNILSISNNSSFKLSPQTHKKCQIHTLMKNKILPMLEGKLKNKVYYENEKDMWLCEIVDCVRSLKTIPIEQIYHGEYAMLLEQIYDALLTIQDQTKRNFQYVLSMIQRTMTDLDKKIIKHLHDYSRVRGEKYQITREEEIQKRNTSATFEIIKIEDKDDSIELQSSINGSIKKHNNKFQNNIDNQIKIDLKFNQNNSCSPKKQYGEFQSTAKKQNTSINNNYKDIMQNGDSFNSYNSNNTTLGNTTNTLLNMNSSTNNDLFDQSINESLSLLNQQSEKSINLISILDSQTIQSLEKMVKEEITI